MNFLKNMFGNLALNSIVVPVITSEVVKLAAYGVLSATSKVFSCLSYCSDWLKKKIEPKTLIDISIMVKELLKSPDVTNSTRYVTSCREYHYVKKDMDEIGNQLPESEKKRLDNLLANLDN